jgi:hypothetical protein
MSQALFNSQSLKKLSDTDLIEQIISIKQQSELLIWLRWSTLRSRFNSTQEFGNFLKPWRIDPDSPLFKISDSSMKRFIQCGKLAEKLKIEDFNSLGISITSFYFLAETGNQDIAVKLFHTVKRKGYTIEQVRQIAADIRQQDSVVATVEQTIDEEAAYGPDYFEPTPLRVIQVDKGIALDYKQTDIADITEEKHDEPMPTVDEKSNDASASFLEPLISKVITIRPVIDKADDAEDYSEPGKVWSDNEMVDAVNSLLKMFNVSWLKEVFILEMCKKQRIEKGYRKKLG